MWTCTVMYVLAITMIRGYIFAILILHMGADILHSVREKETLFLN